MALPHENVQNPIHEAVREASEKHVRELLERPEAFDWLLERDSFGRTPRDLAEYLGEDELHDLLVAWEDRTGARA